MNTFNMNHDFHISIGDLQLKPLSRENLEKLRILRNSKRNFFIHNEEIKESQQIDWYEKYLQRDNDLMFEIVDEANAFYGVIALYNIDQRCHTAEFGRIVICDDAPKYTATNAIKGLLVFAKSALGIGEVTCSVLHDNNRAESVYQRLGFRQYKETDDLLFYKCCLE